jgi:anti-sigma regulatory factor (Ser/Thr protein kinase)
VAGDDASRRRVRAEVAAVAGAAGLDATRVAELDLAVHEVLVNAWQHGHGGDATRPVDVEVTRSATGLQVRVRDGGPPVDAAPSGPAVARHPDERGRGLVLARGLVDGLDRRTLGAGTEVVLRVATAGEGQVNGPAGRSGTAVA